MPRINMAAVTRFLQRIGDREYIIIDSNNPNANLPKVRKCNEAFLKEKGIPYKKVGNMLELWDAKYPNFSVENLPVYIKEGNSFIYVMNMKCETPDKITVEKALKLYNKIKPHLN